jgi:hypothetical protein
LRRGSALEIYAYIMLGVSTVLCAVGVIPTCIIGIALANPDWLLSEAQELRYSNNDAYRVWLGEAGVTLTEDEVTRRRTLLREAVLAAAIHAGHARLTETVPVMVIFGILAFVHLSVIRRLRRQHRESTQMEAHAPR